jgi:hypothetical protein
MGEQEQKSLRCPGPRASQRAITSIAVTQEMTRFRRLARRYGKRGQLPAWVTLAAALIWR